MSYTEQLERDTERTRLELAHTIEELRDHLTPGQMLDEALDYASDGDVGDYLRSFKRQIIDNPVPLGVMGASMAWLVVASAFGRRGKGRTTRERSAHKASDFAADARANARGFAERGRGAGANLADSVRAAGTDIANTTRSAAHDVRDRAAQIGADATSTMRDAASTAGSSLTAAGDSIADHAGRSAEALGEIASDISRNGRVASRAVSDFAHEQPLIVAAAGLVLGALIGALLPSTEIEDRLIGDSSDAAKEKLREVAGEAKDIALHAAEAALDDTAAEPSAHDPADRHEAGGFGPGPSDHASAGHSSEEHPISAEEAEHTHAGGA